jgi:hypothetical protein
MELANGEGRLPDSLKPTDMDLSPCSPLEQWVARLPSMVEHDPQWRMRHFVVSGEALIIRPAN